MKNLDHLPKFRNHLNEMMKDPAFRREFDVLEPEFILIQTLIDRRLKGGLTQADIAKKMGTKQSAISRFESGRMNPTMDFMYRLAEALDVSLKVSVG